MKSENMLRASWLAGLAALFTFGSVQASDDKIDPTWVRPGTDFSVYNKFLVKPLEIDDVKIVRPPWAEDDTRDWSIDIEDSAGIQTLFADAMESVLEENGGYEVVSEPGADVLEVEVEIISIMPYRRPGDEGIDSDGMQVTTLGSGELTGALELRDSNTRHLLLLVEGNKVIGQEYKDWSYLNNMANLDAMFRGFASSLRQALDRAHEKD